MLDHQHGVAQIPEALQGIDELLIIPLMKTDRSPSRTYRTPLSADPICVAKRIRWASLRLGWRLNDQG